MWSGDELQSLFHRACVALETLSDKTQDGWVGLTSFTGGRRGAGNESWQWEMQSVTAATWSSLVADKTNTDAFIKAGGAGGSDLELSHQTAAYKHDSPAWQRRQNSLLSCLISKRQTFHLLRPSSWDIHTDRFDSVSRRQSAMRTGLRSFK